MTMRIDCSGIISGTCRGLSCLRARLSRFTTGGSHRVRSIPRLHFLPIVLIFPPELQMRRPHKDKYRLDNLLEMKAREGVKIYIIL